MDEVIMTVEELKAEILVGNRYSLTTNLVINGSLLIGTDRVLTENDLRKIMDKVSVLRVQEVKEEKEKELEEAGEVLNNIFNVFDDDHYKKLIDTKKEKLKTIIGRILPSNRYLIKKIEDIYSFSNKLFDHSVKVAIDALILNWAWQRKTQKKMINSLEFEKIVTGSLLHDIGFLEISKDLLDIKRLDLVDDEKYSQHPALGFALLNREANDLPSEVSLIVRDHHERLDGSGFPMGIGVDDLSRFSLTVGLADEFVLLMNGELSLRERSFNDIARKFSTSRKIFDKKLIAILIEEFRYLAV